MKLYLDSSALVKIVLDVEDASDEALTLWERATDVVSASIGYVEIRSAIVRRLPPRRSAIVGRRAARLWQDVYVVDVDDDLVRAAAVEAETFRLRALDAIHLAAARSVAFRDLVFATWDAELSAAASAAGLTVAP